MRKKRHLSILGLDTGATWAEVEEAYADLCTVWDEKRFSDDEHLKSKAAKMRRDMDVAYGELKQIFDSPIQNFIIKPTGSASNSRGGQSFIAFLIGMAIGLLFMVVGVITWRDMISDKNREPTIVVTVPSFSDPTYAELEERELQIEPNQRQVEPAPETERVAQLPEKTVEAFVMEREAHVEVEPEEVEPEEVETEQKSVDQASEAVDVPETTMQTDSLETTGDQPGASRTLAIDPEITKPNFKLKDKVYRKQGEEPVKEGYATYTPDIVNASIKCDLEQVKLHLDAGADINMADDRGDTSLAWATKRGCGDIVTFLLEKGADVNRKAANGFTPYIWARVYGRAKLAHLLSKSGAKAQKGTYWWRYENDQKEYFLRRAEKDYCRGRLCGRVNGDKLSTDIGL